MLNCEQYYLEHGLKEHDFKNLDTRKFIKNTSFEFFEWSSDDNIPVNTRIDKKEKYTEFLEEYGDLKKWLTQKRFTLWIELYSKKIGLETVSGKTHGNRWIMLNDDKQEAPEDDGLPF